MSATIAGKTENSLEISQVSVSIFFFTVSATSGFLYDVLLRLTDTLTHRKTDSLLLYNKSLMSCGLRAQRGKRKRAADTFPLDTHCLLVLPICHTRVRFYPQTLGPWLYR